MSWWDSRKEMVSRARRLRREGVASVSDADSSADASANIDAPASKGKIQAGDEADCQLASSVR